MLVVGTDTATNKSVPWDITDGSIADLSKPNAVAVDSTYFGELAVSGSATVRRSTKRR